MTIENPVIITIKPLQMNKLNNTEDVGWFLCLMAYQHFLGYLMPKPFS